MFNLLDNVIFVSFLYWTYGKKKYILHVNLFFNVEAMSIR